VPEPGLATSAFLRFHFLTKEGLDQLGKAFPGGAGRYRTLGLKALQQIEVPVPSYEQQQWYFLASDLYRPYSAREVAAMVAPEVAAKLDPERVYGLWHWNRRETFKRKEWDDMKGKYVTPINLGRGPARSGWQFRLT